MQTAAAAVSGVADSVLVALRAQNEMMYSLQQDLLSTVHWSLGLLATLGTLMIGFSWFVNFRVYERDKTTMRSDLDAHIKSELAGALKTLSASHTSISESVEERIESRVSALRSELERFELRYAETQIEKWLAAGVHGNAIRAALTAIYFSNKRNEGWRVTNYLDVIRTCVQKGGGDDNFVYDELTSALPGLPERHKADIENIMQIVTTRRAARPAR